MNPVAAHLAAAVERHRRHCRDNGITVPPELFQLVNLVSGGQNRTTSLGSLELPEDAGVPLALDFAEAGRLLGCSDRTVRRLVAQGKLRSIVVGAAPRVPRAELERFIADQLECA